MSRHRARHRRSWMLLMMLALGLLSACSGQRAGTRAKAASEIVVPAGVDTAIARQADSLSKALTVDLKAERQATELRRKGRSLVAASDSLWSMIESRQTVSQADSLAAIEEFNRAALALKEAAALQRGAKRSRGDEALQQRVLKYLQEARRYLEKAVLLNPFDLESRSWLARVYQSLATRFERRDDQRKAVEILENLVRLEKGEHVLFRRLGEAYYALGFWQEAYENFAEAARVLRQTAFEAVRDDDISRESLRQAPVDTSALFYYVYYQGDTKAKQYDAEQALSYFRSALTLAPTAADSQSVAAYIDWIEWDAGNIRAAEKRDSLLRLLSKGRYEEAATGFKALLGKLRSAEAKDEIEWRLAVLEYQRLNQKPSAVERLARVVKRQARGTSGTGAENEQRRYTEAYGTMCYNLGLENLTKNRQTAFAYFLQAAATPWSGRAKSYLEIAKLSQNNPEAVIDNALAALKEASGLESEEVGQLYRLLTAAYKRTGRFDEAREYYYKWLTLKER